MKQSDFFYVVWLVMVGLLILAVPYAGYQLAVMEGPLPDRLFSGVGGFAVIGLVLLALLTVLRPKR